VGGEFAEIRLPPPSRSADRTQAPAGVSGKRELFNEWPETFGIFGRLLRKSRVWSPPTELRKPAISGLFCYSLRSNLGPVDCLADLGGFELAHSQLEETL
jgi:hypothetical protein